MMSLPARENWNSFTVEAERVLDNLTAKLLLGWFQSEVSLSKALSPQKLPAAFPCTHFSLMKRTITFILLLMTMSPRNRSCRVSTGCEVNPTQLAPSLKGELGRG